MKTVVVNGCFDLLHIGHVRLLEFAKEQGDYLIVLVNSDKSVFRSKGQSRPIVTCGERMDLLRALSCVDVVIEFDTEDDLCHLLVQMKPDVMIKGKRYEGTPITGQFLVKEVVFYPETPHSTSNTLREIFYGTGAYVR